MCAITGAGATYAFTVSGVAGATYSYHWSWCCTGDGGCQSSVTGEGAVKVTACAGAAYSITGAGVATVTSSAGATFSITGADALWTTEIDFLLGFLPASTCRKWHLSPCIHPFSDL